MHWYGTPPFRDTSDIKPVRIDIWKLVFFSILSLGLYEIYWGYVQFRSVFKKERFFSAIVMAIILQGALFILIKEMNEKLRSAVLAQFGFALAVSYFLLCMTILFDYPYWLISTFSFLPLVVIQWIINSKAKS